MRLSKLILLFILLFPSSSFATWHLYLTPVDGDGQSFTTRTRPKYIGDMNVRRENIPFGRQGITLVAADVSDNQDATLQAFPDVIKIPDNLDQQIGAGPLNAVKNRLESIDIPAGWITANTSYRTVIKTVIGMSAFLQRFRVINKDNSPFINNSTVTLDTTWTNLPNVAKNRLMIVAEAMSLDTSGMTGATTLRQIIKAISDQWIANHGGIKLGEIQIADLSLKQKGHRIFKAMWREFIQPAIAFATSMTDNFNRPNANPINGTWATAIGNNPLQIFNNLVRMVTGTDGTSHFTGFIPTDDQEDAVTIVSVSTRTFLALVLRFDPTDNTMYMAGCTPDNGNFFIVFLLAPEFSELSSTAGATTCVPSNRLSTSISGTDISFSVNGIEILTGSDASVTSGYCGLHLEKVPDVDNPSPAEPEADDFFCSDLGSPTAVNLPRRGLIQ